MAAHRYWRAYMREGGSTNTLCAEMEMRTTAGGADVTGTGTAMASGETGPSEQKAYAFDNNVSTYWQVSGTGAGIWLGYDFGVGNNKDIVEISMQPLSGFSARMMREFDVQYSDDATTWVTAWSCTFTSWTNAAQVFTKPGGTPSRRWRLRPNTLQNGSSTMSCAEMEMRATSGGADQTGSGTATARTTFGSIPGTNDPSKAFDNNTATLWSGNADVAQCGWLAYDFGSGVTKTIQEIMFTARNDLSFTQSPTAGWIESGDDGINWISRWTFSGLSWTQGSSNTFGNSVTTGRRRQIINC